MKTLLWIVLGFALLEPATWLVKVSGTPTGPIIFLLVLLFAVPPIGAFWMMYQVIRHRDNRSLWLRWPCLFHSHSSGTTSIEFVPVNTKRGMANPTKHFECNGLITTIIIACLCPMSHHCKAQLKVDGKLVLRIPLSAGGDQFMDCSKGISEVEGEYLKITIPEWLAGMLRISEGSIVSIDNENGKCNIRPANPAPVQ